MKWWVFILLPFWVYSQETYNNCDEVEPQNYEVEYNSDRLYFWEISGGEILYNNNNSITIQWPDIAGTYNISVYTTQFNCVGDTSYHEITIEECHTQIFIPTVFTPNGDGVNDTWQIFNIENYEPYINIQVYNRLGQLVYKRTEEYNTNLWDGTNMGNGKDLQIGVYNFIIRVNTGESEKSYTGCVTIIR